MKKFLHLFLCAASTAAAGADIAGVPRDSNFNNTSGYDSTRVEARLVVNVADDTDVVHFIRDNNDPRVVTKTYVISNVDAYDFRDYLRQMVQAKRVGNTMLQQAYPGNTTDPAAATVSAPELTPVAVQPGYNPAAQLGSNTAVECLKYVDGTGLLLVSAEEYRFQDHPNGMGFDSLVKFLDKPDMGATFGTQTFIYVPKFVPARNLLPLIQNVGMNITDITELWQGSDLVTSDPELNWLIFDVANYSQANIETMLKLYDVPIPEAKVRYTLYEIYHENDDRIGIDFQAWKNNQGVDFFSVGGRYRDNWSASYGGILTQTGSERTSFYNFNPKWNSRYLDFLVSIGHARISSTGELTVRNNTPASIERKTQVFYIAASDPLPGTSTGENVGSFKWLSDLVQRTIDPDYPVAKGSKQEVTKSAAFGFSMKITNARINLNEASFAIELSNSSLIGFNSDGSPRVSDNNVVAQEVSLPLGTNRFIIGGLKKQEVVKSNGGVPFLCDIPYLKYLFSTVSQSVKTSELILVAECSWNAPAPNADQPAKSRSHKW